MTEQPHTERLIEHVELVRSRGDPAQMKLCVMSLVARLAQEAHGDQPRCASPVIAAFARAVNDAMDRQTRQRLRPFAPRIVGTADRLDDQRQALLHAALIEMLLPAIVTDLQASARTQDQAQAAELTAELTGQLTHGDDVEQLRIAQDIEWDRAALIWPLRNALTARRDGDGVQQAESVARVLIAAVACVARPTRRNWYWDRAVELLDQLCDVAEDAPVTPVAQDTRPTALA
ncbi:hypothetical protein [Rhodovibrio salinarum]|uniref:Uncharacterized protein n=1 Tax=Rhodovibrio salinarum TaxID=1087 RepID=A0A934UYW1_9PROT|nr:hypothetical protein [Rhodovibrio salinarum]MBK1696432.1 hypothetical protein [Rhodovibrio salinarum]